MKESLFQRSEKQKGNLPVDRKAVNLDNFVIEPYDLCLHGIMRMTTLKFIHVCDFGERDGSGI
jgi:hypothetical protein